MKAVGEYGMMIIAGIMIPITIYAFYYKTKLNRLNAEI